MLVRIVRMTFAPDKVDQFLAHFDEAAPHIRSVPGCRHLELWQGAEAPTVCTTYSQWKRAEALDEYRDSDLFRRTWSTVRPLFAERPRARSYTVARPADAIDAAARDATDPGQP
ncbi:putative quinol monooxygenase [Salinibacter ruber]|uniref:putative quinol monooxygenase n=1 Tax=Salinibacter ruber TaxID=146919 RepID=UPI002167B62A|nr:quinol monooxygenase YgiN [Salinibacter ruber]